MKEGVKEVRWKERLTASKSKEEMNMRKITMRIVLVAGLAVA